MERKMNEVKEERKGRGMEYKRTQKEKERTGKRMSRKMKGAEQMTQMLRCIYMPVLLRDPSIYTAQ